MPKKKKKSKAQRKKQVPFVSVCTPTFNRRPFFEMCIACLEAQTYPHSRIEWNVYDDGSDSVRDLVEAFAKRTSIQVHYFRSETYVPLSTKRNFLNDKAQGSFLCYWDDDDFYQPTRIQESVQTLQAHPEAMMAGSSAMYCYFNDTQEIWKFGPYSDKHSTAAVFFFRRELLEQTRFDDDVFIAEEKAFLKDYTVPVVQMNPNHTIVVLAHSQNSFDKRSMISGGETQFVKRTTLTLDQLVQDHDIRHFITDRLDPMLIGYTDGDVRKKPDLLVAMLDIQRGRLATLTDQYDKVARSHSILHHQLQTLQTQIRAAAAAANPSADPNSSVPAVNMLPPHMRPRVPAPTNQGDSPGRNGKVMRGPH